MNSEGTVVDQENIYDLGADGTDRKSDH